ncbi:TPA: AmmeMemoRadiSam system radical SAM enzyme [Candidatus Sumerlaeota bacterium]|nr:AmmeMemoRadiSam system radical SAM enzyme [Candidatus Sumerlaeota bacterium]
MKARLYTATEDGSKEVVCHLCHHRCHIAPRHLGICGARRNDDGELVSLVYGRAVSLNPDPIEKKPLFHFLPGTHSMSTGTPGCNFTCAFCQNNDISQFLREFPGRIPMGWTKPDEIVQAALNAGCASMSFTYTEPTIFYEYAEDTGRLGLEKHLPSCFVSNGFMTPETVDAMKDWVRAINVDLKCFNADTYRKVMGGTLDGVLETLVRLHHSGIWLEITTLVVPGMNDSDDELCAIAEFIAKLDPCIPWHVSRFFPHYKMRAQVPTVLSTIQRAIQIGEEAGLKFVYCGNVLDGKYESTWCMDCGALLIRRSGFTVLDMPMLAGGACPDCGKKCPGVWSI